MFRRLLDTVDEESGDARRAEAETLYTQLHKTNVLAEELEVNARIISRLNEDSVDEATVLIRVLEEYLGDEWGAETYQASLAQKLDELEDSLHKRRARSSALLEELPRLRSVLS